MLKIAFYGKGGIGKTTTVTNISAALAEKGYRVLQVGCDPKADSTRLLLAGAQANTEDKCSAAQANTGYNCPAADEGGISEISAMFHDLRNGGTRTVMDHIRARQPFSPEDIVRPGYAGVLCAEAGGPLPGQGCAGRAVITALEKMEEIGVYDQYKPDIVLYDVLGDVVCGGFAMPMRRGYADYIYILTSGESMSLYAAANIGLALEHFRGRGYAQLGGIILNCRNVPAEEERAQGLAAELSSQILGTLSQSNDVRRAEEMRQCVMQAFPDSAIAQEYRALAEAIEKSVILPNG